MTEGRRSALVVANDDYQDGRLRRLRAPAADARELARVLRDPDIGGFEVEVSLNEPEHVLRRQLSTFFDNRSIDDVLLLHLSCHGLKDDDGRLYFATPDTEMDHLDATSISSEFVNRQMTRSRSRRILLLLDCCYSGAFARGMLSRAGDRMDIKERFDGRGRIVLTASSAMEYSFEGDQLAGEGQPSVFTSALVRGLFTGEADRNHDGFISVDELYDFAYDQVRAVAPSQTPGKWVFDVQGDFYVARSAFEIEVEVPELPAELLATTKSPYAHVRAGAAEELGMFLNGPDVTLSEKARAALEELREDDSQRVVRAVTRLLGDLVPDSPAEPDNTPPAESSGLAAISEAPELPGLPEVAEPVEADEPPQLVETHEPAGPVRSSSPEADVTEQHAPVPVAAFMPPAAPVQPTTFDAPAATWMAEPNLPRRLPRILRIAAIALLAAVPMVLVGSGDDGWNYFAVLSPFEAIGAALVTFLVGRRLNETRTATVSAAGTLLVIGVLMTVASLGSIKFSIQRIGPGGTVLSFVVLISAVVILGSGIACARLSPGRDRAGLSDLGGFVLALAAGTLTVASLLVNYDGYSSLWSEVGEGTSAEFFFEPALAVAVIVAGLVTLATRARFAAALLVTVGGLMALHFAGVLVASWRAVGEVGDVGAGGFIGVLGGLVAISAGGYTLRFHRRHVRHVSVVA